MGIPQYAHYYLTEEQIEELHRKEIWSLFESVGRNYNCLQSYAQEWFKKYFSDMVPQGVKECLSQ